ncbi:uncharacterized protein LOC142223653 isoform X2 [Haematobia irritans]|uniref:uncharacterized protein LOC142223653 isoform X2 n=1 Tax=Haematobia irritans TaxID=7368 RepID=UPI003F50CF9A
MHFKWIFLISCIVLCCYGDAVRCGKTKGRSKSYAYKPASYAKDRRTLKIYKSSYTTQKRTTHVRRPTQINKSIYKPHDQSGLNLSPKVNTILTVNRPSHRNTTFSASSPSFGNAFAPTTFRNNTVQKPSTFSKGSIYNVPKGRNETTTVRAKSTVLNSTPFKIAGQNFTKNGFDKVNNKHFKKPAINTGRNLTLFSNMNQTFTPAIVSRNPLPSAITKVNRTLNSAVPWNNSVNGTANRTFTPAVVLKNPLPTGITKVNHTLNSAVPWNNTSNNTTRNANRQTPGSQTTISNNFHISVGNDNGPNGGLDAPISGYPTQTSDKASNSKSNGLQDFAKKAIKGVVKKLTEKNKEAPKVKKATYTSTSNKKSLLNNQDYTWDIIDDAPATAKVSGSMKNIIIVVVICILIVLVGLGTIVYFCNKKTSVTLQ